MMRRFALFLLLAAASAGCGGPDVDLTKALQVVDFSSGWHDEGIVDGQNKLVPTATFKLKNVSDQTLPVLQVNAVFRRPDEQQELGAAFVPVTKSQGLAPGETSSPIIVKSNFGYKGSEPRATMLENRLFVDAKVEIFAKYGSHQWVKIAEYPIERRLITS
jgi:hypothetical protein